MSNLTPIAPQFAFDDVTSLVLKEKKDLLSLTGDSCKIHDKDGNLIFEVKANKLTMSQRRVLKDANGQDIGQLRYKRVTPIHTAIYIGTMENEKKCMVKEKGKMNITKCDADIYVDEQVIGEASGNWRAKEFQIKIGEDIAATVHRKTGAMGHLFDADSYIIDVMAGVDAAFITMVVIGLDEIYHDDED